MEDRKTVQLGYASHTNVSFRGTVDTGLTREEWDDLDGKAKEEVFAEVVWELVDMWEVDDE